MTVPHSVIRLTRRARDGRRATAHTVRSWPRITHPTPGAARWGGRAGVLGDRVLEHHRADHARGGAALQRDGGVRGPWSREVSRAATARGRRARAPASRPAPTPLPPVRRSRRGSTRARRGCGGGSTTATTSCARRCSTCACCHVGLRVSVAGWTDRWRYAWPRDVSFVAAALARGGHPTRRPASSVAAAGSSARTGGSRRATTLHPAAPGRRIPQLDGTGWVVVGRRPDRDRGTRAGRRSSLTPAAPDARAQRATASSPRSTPRRLRCRRRRPTTGRSPSTP